MALSRSPETLSGNCSRLATSVTSNFRQRRSSYVQQFLLGLQLSITANDLLDVNYVGNHGIHIITSDLNRTQLNPISAHGPGSAELPWSPIRFMGTLPLEPAPAASISRPLCNRSCLPLSTILRSVGERCARRLLQLQRVAGELQPPLQSRV